MSGLIWFDGFERVADLSKRGYTVVGPSYLTIGQNNARYASCSSIYRSTNNATAYLDLPLPGVFSHLIIGLAVRFDLSTSNGEKLLSLLANGNEQCALQVYDSGRGGGMIAQYRPYGDPSVGTYILPVMQTAGDAVKSTTWHYLEWEIFVHNETGISKLRIDGVEAFSMTAQDMYGRPPDTKAYSYGDAIDTVRLMHPSNCSWNIEIDDLYIVDCLAGGTYLGEVHTRRLVPTADGTYIQWTPSTGTANWSLIDETTSNEGTDYVSALSTATDTYVVENTDTSFVTGGSVDVRAVGIQSRVRQTDSAGFSHVMYDGSLWSSGNIFPTGTWQTAMSVFETQGNASLWTTGAVDAIEIGMQRILTMRYQLTVTASAELVSV